MTISPKRRSADEFAAAWRQVCNVLRNRTGLKEIADEEIRKETDGDRIGQ